MRIGPVGIWEILIILVVILLIFGPRRLPEMAKGLGQSVREFRKGIRDMKNEFDGDNDGGGERDRSERAGGERRDERPEPTRDAPRPEPRGERADVGRAAPTPRSDGEPNEHEPRRTDAGA